MTKTYAGFRQLTSALHFYTAAVEQTPVLVFHKHNGELIGSGRIESVQKDVRHGDTTDDIIVIKGEYYLRSNCVFAYGPDPIAN